MKIKHIIMTRWWLMPPGLKTTILDDNCLNSRLDYLTNNLFSSLKNQTNMDFEFVLQVHPKHTEKQIERMEEKISGANPPFSHTLRVFDDNFHEYIKPLYDENDVIIQTRIDDDDFVNRNAVQDTRDVIGNGNFDMILSGYHRGYKYFEGSDLISPMRYNYEGGHFSAFQSIITNTKRVPFSKYTDPCIFNHTNVRRRLNDLGYNMWFVVFDRPDGYIWFRHSNAISYNGGGKQNDLVKLTDQDKEKMKFTFGIDIDTRK